MARSGVAKRERLGREDWIATGVRVLGEQGAGAVRIDRLCAALDVTKGSFYWHFKSRAEFLDAVLDYWRDTETRSIVERVEARGGSAADRIRHLFEEANSGRVDFSAELAIRHWARADRRAAKLVTAVDRERLDYLDVQLRLLTEDERLRTVAATLIYSLIFGEAMIVRRETKGDRRQRQWSSLEAVLAMLGAA